jgi:hypothetical protein
VLVGFVRRVVAEPKIETEESKSRWDIVGSRATVILTLIGVAAAAVGLFGAIYPGGVGRLLGLSSSSPDPGLEVFQKKAEATGPRLDVSYLFLDSFLAGSETNTKPSTKEAQTILRFPIVQNSVFQEFREDFQELGDRPPASAAAGCGFHGSTTLSVAFLVLRNRGLRDATTIGLGVTHSNLGEHVPIHENPGGEDYITKISSAATETPSPIRVRLPQTLGPGDGTLLPLWVSIAPRTRYDRWCIVSDTAFLPRSLSFSDPQLHTVKTSLVRKLAAPTMIENGVVTRG